MERLALAEAEDEHEVRRQAAEPQERGRVSQIAGQLLRRE